MIKKIIEKDLNNQQWQAANWTDSSSLILAWAGSGKTRVLIYKVANLVFCESIPPQRILAVTFTNKAANEMKQRLVEIWQKTQQADKNNSDNDITDFEELLDNENTNQKHSINHNTLKRVGTFHSIFLKILKYEIKKTQLWYDNNFNIYDTWESLSVIKNILKENNYKEKLEPKEVKWKISSLKNQWILPSKFLHKVNNDWEEEVANVYKKYQDTLIKSNCMDFDDLLLYTKILLEEYPDILEKYQTLFKYILVDEAQDTNQIQFDIIKLLWQKWNVTFIWDDFQSIYWRRWAVMENFLNLEKRWPDLKTFKLETNYRSKDHIVQAGNCIISQNQKQYQKNVVSNRWWQEEKIRVFSFKDEYDEAEQITNLIKKLKQEKNANWSDFAILYRTNAQSQPFEQILLQEWIPYKVWWWFKFFERKEIKDILSYIKYVLNPQDNIALKRIINTPSRKIWQTTINKIEEFAANNWFDIDYVIKNIDTLPIKLNAGVVNNIKSFATSIKFIKNQLETLYPADFISNLVNSIKYKEYLIHLEWKEKAEEKIENIWQLINLASKYNEKTYNEPHQAMTDFFEEISLIVDTEEAQNEQQNVVKLMSVHGSKGLEFPVVFLVWLEENIFPLAKAKFEQKEMEEERRLMYVAITRAEDLLFFSYAESRMKRWQLSFNKPSRFIEEIPQDLLKTYNIQWQWSYNENQKEFEEWDLINHKLFGQWKVLEVWNEIIIVKFTNPKFGIRKMDAKFVEKVE